MPMPCYLSVEGVNQGKIEGSCAVSGHEGMILVQAVDHLVDIPKNPQTGLPAGKRVHQGMTLTKEQVIAHMRANLTAYKAPKIVEFRDSLPTTLTDEENSR